MALFQPLPGFLRQQSVMGEPQVVKPIPTSQGSYFGVGGTGYGGAGVATGPIPVTTTFTAPPSSPVPEVKPQPPQPQSFAGETVKTEPLSVTFYQMPGSPEWLSRKEGGYDPRAKFVVGTQQVSVTRASNFFDWVEAQRQAQAIKPVVAQKPPEANVLELRGAEPFQNARVLELPRPQGVQPFKGTVLPPASSQAGTFGEQQNPLSYAKLAYGLTSFRIKELEPKDWGTKKDTPLRYAESYVETAKSLGRGLVSAAPMTLMLGLQASTLQPEKIKEGAQSIMATPTILVGSQFAVKQALLEPQKLSSGEHLQLAHQLGETAGVFIGFEAAGSVYRATPNLIESIKGISFKKTPAITPMLTEGLTKGELAIRQDYLFAVKNALGPNVPKMEIMDTALLSKKTPPITTIKPISPNIPFTRKVAEKMFKENQPRLVSEGIAGVSFEKLGEWKASIKPKPTEPYFIKEGIAGIEFGKIAEAKASIKQAKEIPQFVIGDFSKTPAYKTKLRFYDYGELKASAKTTTPNTNTVFGEFKKVKPGVEFLKTSELKPSVKTPKQEIVNVLGKFQKVSGYKARPTFISVKSELPYDSLMNAPTRATYRPIERMPSKAKIKPPPRNK